MELVAEEDAPKLDYLELLQGHPSDISQADKAAAAEARQQAAAAAESVRLEVRRPGSRCGAACSAPARLKPQPRPCS